MSECPAETNIGNVAAGHSGKPASSAPKLEAADRKESLDALYPKVFKKKFLARLEGYFSYIKSFSIFHAM
jgi:hypothetical protein